MADPDLRSLSALCRLRRIETDAARRALSAALGREAALADQDAAARAEMDGARRITGYFDRDTFSAWWDRQRGALERLAAALRDAEASIAAARDDLTRRRVAETAAEEALARAVALQEAEAARRDQVTLEDVSRALQRAAAARARG